MDPELIEHAQRYAADEGKAAFSALLDRRIPTAVIAGNDMIAVGCCGATRAGIPCPAEVSVIGFNNMPLSDFLDPALTTVAIPQYDIGARAAQLVLDLIADQPRSHVLVPVALLVRGSTGPPPVRPSRRS